jgi:hypothetical protein
MEQLGGYIAGAEWPRKRDRAELVPVRWRACWRGGERLTLGSGSRRCGRVALSRLAQLIEQPDQRRRILACWPSSRRAPANCADRRFPAPLEAVNAMVGQFAAPAGGHLLQITDPAEEEFPLPAASV